MTKRHLFLPLLFSMLLPTACAQDAARRAPPPDTVQRVDLTRYVGVWHEIARYPNRFQKECRESTASYTIRDDGAITVVNRCRTDSGDKEARGIAKVVDSVTNARLKVSFFRPFYGDYWIFDLGTDYEYAVVGTPDRKYLWILSRTPVMDARLYEKLLEKIRGQGFDPKRLLVTGAVAERT
jgi:apolipoprotein D and lipocalin family protein